MVADIPMRLQIVAVAAWFVVAAGVGFGVYRLARVVTVRRVAWLAEAARRALATTAGCFAGAQAAVAIGGPYLLCGGQPGTPVTWRTQLWLSAVIGVALGVGTVVQDRFMAARTRGTRGT